MTTEETVEQLRSRVSELERAIREHRDAMDTVALDGEPHDRKLWSALDGDSGGAA